MCASRWSTWWVARRAPTSEGSNGGRRPCTTQSLPIRSQGGHPTRSIQGNPGVPAKVPGGAGAQSSIHHHVPGHHETIRGGSTLSQQIRPSTTCYHGRRVGNRQGAHMPEMGKELAAVRPGSKYYAPPNRESRDMPSEGSKGGVGNPPVFPTRCPAPPIPTHGAPGLDRLLEGRMGGGREEGGSGPKNLQPPQYQEGICYQRLRRRLPGDRGPKTRRLGVTGVQNST